MDNVVQNIRLEDIIPSNFQNNNSKQIQELASSIEKYGIIEPLLLRQQNDKYEIILGNKRYQAAKILGLSSVPALIKNLDDEVLKEYLMVNDNLTTNKFINPTLIPNKELNQRKKDKSTEVSQLISKKSIPNEIQNNFENHNFIIDCNKQSTDIVNLSDLNKEENERDDFKMNNEFMNNNPMNNMGTSPMNPNPSMQEPTFGGRFFPSLEDEPTNMNMGMDSFGMNQTNNMTPGSSNNLIDLTDIGMEKESQIPPMQNFQASEPIGTTTDVAPSISNLNQQPMINPTMNIPNSNEISNSMVDPMNNIINIGNLQNNNPPIEPEAIGINQPIMGNSMMNSNSMMDIPQSIPQFDMSQNIAPTEFIQNQTINPVPVNVSMNESVAPNDFYMNQVNDYNFNPLGQVSMNDTMQINQQPIQDFGTPMYNQGVEPQINSTPHEETMNNSIGIQVKDITPVVNTIKGLVANLETFGYKLNIIEEQLPTTTKLTIEIDK